MGRLRNTSKERRTWSELGIATGGLWRTSFARGRRAPETLFVHVQTFELFVEQICSVELFVTTRQRSPTGGNVLRLQVPRPDSKSSKNRMSLRPATTVTLSIDHPSAAG